MASQVRRTAEQWQQHINCQLTSGLSIKRYCQKHKLTLSGFYLWRTKIAEDTDAVTEPSTAHNWLPVSLDNSEATVTQYSTDITLALPGGIHLTIRSH